MNINQYISLHLFTRMKQSRGAEIYDNDKSDERVFNFVDDSFSWINY